MADLITGNTQLSATKQDLISSVVQRELAFQAKLAPYFTDVSMFAAPGAKQISFPRLSSFTVIDRASGVAGDSSVLTASVDTLLLDINAYVAWIIDSSDAIQSAIPAQLEFAKRAAAAHGRYVDTNIISKLEAVGVPTTTAGNLTAAVVLEMQETLLKNDAVASDLALFIAPAQRTILLQISEFKSAEVYGGAAMIPSGVVGSLYGMPVVVHNGLTAQQYFMAEKSGLAYGFQMGPSYSEQMANEFGSQAKRAVLDQLFGVEGMQKGLKGVLSTQSPLVIKDNN
jgi:hypothetical protein